MMSRRLPFVIRASAAAGAILLAAGCGTDLGGAIGGNSITAYQAASAFSPTGHHVAALADGRIRVTATGSPSTPKARVEKIALARAAEYGAEQGHKFFQATAPQVAIRCAKRDYLEKGEKKQLPVRGHPVAEIDVVYASAATGPDFRPSKGTADALKAELAAENADDSARAAAAAEVAAQCGS